MTAILISLIPFVVVWIAIFLPIAFSKAFSSSIQGLACGFLLGGITIDLMPRVLQSGIHFSYIVSFIVGFIVMLVLQGGEGDCCNAQAKKALRKFLFPFSIEFFITGILIGIASSANFALMFVLAVSFGLCNLVCGLSISSRLTASQIFKGRRALLTLMISVLLPIGALFSSILVAYVPATWIAEMLSFAIATLLFLVLDELLPEAMSGNKTVSISLLFGGFSVVYFLFYLMA